MLICGASAAYAAPGGQGESVGLLGYLFAGFFAVIIVTQLVPAAILFVSMLKGVFSLGDKADVAQEKVE
jgi:hypothetical protein